MAGQIGGNPKHLDGYAFNGRTANDHHSEIRKLLDFRRPTNSDAEKLTEWLLAEILPKDHDPEHLTDMALGWYRAEGIEAPTASWLERFVKSAVRSHEELFFEDVAGQLTDTTRTAIDALLAEADAEPDSESPQDAANEKGFNDLKADPGRPGLESVMVETAKLKRIDLLGLPQHLLSHVSGCTSTRTVGTMHRSRLRACSADQLVKRPACAILEGQQIHESALRLGE